MAGNQNPHYAREALRTMLTDDLPALLDAIDTEMADGIILHDLTHIYMGALQAFDTLPVACILTRGTQYPDLERSDDIRYHQLQLQVYEQSIEMVGTMLPAEVVSERLERTMTAVHTMIQANQTLLVAGTHNADMTIIEEIQYSDFGGDEAAMFRGVLMNLTAWFSS